MARKRFMIELIIRKLSKAESELGLELITPQIGLKIGISAQTCYLSHKG